MSLFICADHLIWAECCILYYFDKKILIPPLFKDQFHEIQDSYFLAQKTPIQLVSYLLYIQCPSSSSEC